MAHPYGNIRKMTGARPNTPVVIIDSSDQEPMLMGEAGFWLTERGVIIENPHSYGRFGKATYHQSTRRVEVGLKWLERNDLKALGHYMLQKLTAPEGIR